MKPYKEDTPLWIIIRDGWSRGFAYSQVVEEAAEMGYYISDNIVKACYYVHEEDMIASWNREAKEKQLRKDYDLHCEFGLDKEK